MLSLGTLAFAAPGMLALLLVLPVFAGINKDAPLELRAPSAC